MTDGYTLVPRSRNWTWTCGCGRGRPFEKESGAGGVGASRFVVGMPCGARRHWQRRSAKRRLIKGRCSALP
jgi:hypothetical protein